MDFHISLFLNYLPNTIETKTERRKQRMFFPHKTIVRYRKIFFNFLTPTVIIFLLPKSMKEYPIYYHLPHHSVEEREHGFHVKDEQTGQRYFATRTDEGPGAWFWDMSSRDFPYSENARLSDESAQYWSKIVKTAKAIERNRIRKFINELQIKISQSLPKSTCSNSGW